LLQPAELEELKNTQTQQAVTDFQKLGLTNQETLTNLVNGNYKLTTGTTTFKTPELEADLKNKGILKFTNDKGNIVLIDPKTGELYNRNEEVDYFSPLGKIKSN